MQYGIERARQIIDFYSEHKLDYYQGLNNFLQTDGERRDVWMDEYYTYLRQPLHSTPEYINTPQLQQDIPQLTFSDLKQKYSQFWETDNTYFSGGDRWLENAKGGSPTRAIRLGMRVRQPQG